MKQSAANPFTPIFGKVPAYMAGRERLSQEMQIALSSEGNDPNLVSLFVGARGTGKTAMLSMCADMAEADGWIAARITATPGMLDEIVQRIYRRASHLIKKEPSRKLSGVGIAAIGSAEWETIPPAELIWRSRMDGLLDLTSADVAFLKAMFEDDGVTSQSELSRRLGKKSGHVSKYKKRLLQQGLIQERAKGQLEFCLPGFREYLIREAL